MSTIERLIACLPDAHTAALIQSPHNRLYLTGMETSSGYVLITPQYARFFTDFRYIEAARQNITIMESVECQRLSEAFLPLFAEQEITHLWVEEDGTTLQELSALQKAFKSITVSGGEPLDTAIRALRRHKTEEQMAHIREAQRLTDEGFSYILSRIEVGRTEKEVALDLEFYMRRQGADSVSFDFIVVAGENSSKPHGVPGNRPLQPGDFVTMDFGATVNGWHSDMTRTVAIGGVTEEQKRIYDTVLKAQSETLAALRPGLSCAEADGIARGIITDAGYGEQFGHSTGHGVGVEIHEGPNLSPRSAETLEIGDVVTVEPGIYLPGKGGVRIEDMVWIRENGCENLTKSPKNLIIL